MIAPFTLKGEEILLYSGAGAERKAPFSVFLFNKNSLNM